MMLLIIMKMVMMMTFMMMMLLLMMMITMMLMKMKLKNTIQKIKSNPISYEQSSVRGNLKKANLLDLLKLHWSGQWEYAGNMFFTFYISSFLALFATKHSSHLLSPHNLTSPHHVTGRWNRWCVIIIISMPFIIITTMLTGGGGGASSFSWTSHLSHPLHQWTFRFQVSFIIYDSVIVISNVL